MDDKTRDFFVGLNGIEFHRQYFELMIKPSLEFFVQGFGGLKLQDLLWARFLSAVCINYVLRHSVNPKTKKLIKDELNFKEYVHKTAEWVLPEEDIPKTREDFSIFLIWISK